LPQPAQSPKQTQRRTAKVVFSGGASSNESQPLMQHVPILVNNSSQLAALALRQICSIVPESATTISDTQRDEDESE